MDTNCDTARGFFTPDRRHPKPRPPRASTHSLPPQPCASTTLLHRVHGRNGYCGPAAITACLGITTDEATDLIRPFAYGHDYLWQYEDSAKPRSPIRGVYDNELILAVDSLD